MRGLIPSILLLALACTAGGAGDTTDDPGSTGPASTGAAPTTGAPATTGEANTGGEGSETGGPDSTGEPVDGLRVNHLQALGTHNSYHISPGSSVKDLDYTHRPLPDQLDGGVRQFELDVHFNQPGEAIDIYHLEVIDMMSTCATLTDCLQAMRGWSDAHAEHHMLYLMLEIKTPYNQILVDDLFDTLEQQILEVWPRERLLTPDDLQGDAADLPAAIAARGWPTVEATRGKLLVVLHDGANWRARYVADGTAGRLLFPDAFGDLSLPYAAVHSINDAIDDAATIADVVDAGHIVRTRADADNVEPPINDHTRADAALASGATFISTDYPPPKGELDYVFAIPDGTPSRCNPRSAPPDCTAAQIEAL